MPVDQSPPVLVARAQEILERIDKLLVDGKPVDRRNWHITLAFIGEFPERRIPELQKRVDRIEMQPFRLVFDYPRGRLALVRKAGG